MTTRIALALLLSLACTACGGDEPAGERAQDDSATTPPPPHPAEIAKAVAPVETPLEIVHDDASLGELLELHKKIVAAGADVGGAMAIGAGSERDYRWYAQALLAWRALEEAALEGGDGASRELEQLDERIAELEAALASASAEERPGAQRTLDLTKRMRPSLAKHAESVRNLVTPANRKLVERWKPRFDTVAPKADK